VVKLIQSFFVPFVPSCETILLPQTQENRSGRNRNLENNGGDILDFTQPGSFFKLLRDNDRQNLWGSG
jgi:hypothetical protein